MKRSNRSDNPCVDIEDLRIRLSNSEAREARLTEALERETVEVSLERTWCRTCRTENRSRERSRATHPHARECVLFRAAIQRPDSTGNVCEHGDHPAPEGKRFCSPACQACEITALDVDSDGCVGICQGFDYSPTGGFR